MLAEEVGILSVQDCGDGILVIDSRLIAERLGIEHRAFMQTIKKYQDKIEDKFGVLTFQMEQPPEGSQGGRPEKCALLTEPQATTLMCFSRNTEQVVACKLELVEAFEKAKCLIKDVVPAQFDRIRELELQIEVAKAQADIYRQQRLFTERGQTLFELHGASVLALIQGRPEAVASNFIEVERTVMCNENGTPLARFEGVSKTAMAKHFGMKRASDFVAWLQSLGKEDLLIQGFTAVRCEYLPRECVLELNELWAERKGERQLLIGE